MFKRLVRRAIATGRVQPDAVAVATDDGLIHELLHEAPPASPAASASAGSPSERSTSRPRAAGPDPSWPSDDPGPVGASGRSARPGRRPLTGELFLDFPAKAAMLALDRRS